MEEELQGLGGEHSHRFTGGKVERDLFRWLVPPPENPQPETRRLSTVVGRGWMVRLWLQSHTQREDRD